MQSKLQASLHRLLALQQEQLKLSPHLELPSFSKLSQLTEQFTVEQAVELATLLEERQKAILQSARAKHKQQGEASFADRGKDSFGAGEEETSIQITNYRKQIGDLKILVSRLEQGLQRANRQREQAQRRLQSQEAKQEKNEASLKECRKRVSWLMQQLLRSETQKESRGGLIVEMGRASEALLEEMREWVC